MNRPVPLLLLLTLFAAVPLGAAEAGDLQPAKEAIATLHGLRGGVNDVVAHMRSANFGPFPLAGRCRYGGFIGIGVKTFNWSWSPNFSLLKADFENRYDKVRIVAGRFEPAFSGVNHWLTVSLPAFSRTFDAQAARLQEASAILGNPESTEQQKREASATVEKAIAVLTTDLTQGESELRSGVTPLSAFNGELKAQLDEVDGARSNMDLLLSFAQNDLDETTVRWPCGQADIRARFDGVKAIVRSEYDGVLDAARRSRVTSADSDRAVSILLGTIGNLQNRYTGVLEALQSAKISPAGAVQQLYLTVTTLVWRDLANYAQEQLGNRNARPSL